MGASTNGGTSATPNAKPAIPPTVAPSVSHAYQRIAFTRSRSVTLPCQSRRSARCSAVNPARCGGTNVMSGGVRGSRVRESSAPSARAGALSDRDRCGSARDSCDGSASRTGCRGAANAARARGASHRAEATCSAPARAGPRARSGLTSRWPTARHAAPPQSATDPPAPSSARARSRRAARFGASGRSSAIGLGRSLTCLSSSAIELPASNGTRPVSIW